MAAILAASVLGAVTAPTHAQLRVVNFNIAQLNGTDSALIEVFSALKDDDRPGFAVAPHVYVFQEVRSQDFSALTALLDASVPPGVSYAAATYTERKRGRLQRGPGPLLPHRPADGERRGAPGSVHRSRPQGGPVEAPAGRIRLARRRVLRLQRPPQVVDGRSERGAAPERCKRTTRRRRVTAGRNPLHLRRRFQHLSQPRTGVPGADSRPGTGKVTIRWDRAPGPAAATRSSTRSRRASRS